jgi:hypothetical protein
MQCVFAKIAAHVIFCVVAQRMQQALCCVQRVHAACWQMHALQYILTLYACSALACIVHICCTANRHTNLCSLVIIYATCCTTALRNTERAKSALQARAAAAVLASATQDNTLAFAVTGAVCYAASVVADKLIQLFHCYEFNHQDNE